MAFWKGQLVLRYTFSIPGKVPWLLLARLPIIRPLPDLIRPRTLSIMPHDCSRLSGTSRVCLDGRARDDVLAWALHTLTMAIRPAVSWA